MSRIWLGPTPGNLASGLIGAGILLPVELVALQTGDLLVWWGVATRYATLGLFLSGTFALAQRLITWLETGPTTSAAIHGAVSLPWLFPLLHHMLDGGFAATVPGARWGYLWRPSAWCSRA